MVKGFVQISFQFSVDLTNIEKSSSSELISMTNITRAAPNKFSVCFSTFFMNEYLNDFTKYEYYFGHKPYYQD